MLHQKETPPPNFYEPVDNAYAVVDLPGRADQQTASTADSHKTSPEKGNTNRLTKIFEKISLESEPLPQPPA